MTAISLSETQINQQLETLPGWSLVNEKLHKQFVFQDFKQAFDFMTQVAFLSESMGHHPDWFNSYKTVTIELYTHSKKAVTNLDIELASGIEKIVKGE